MKTLYTTSVLSEGDGRRGRVRSDDGLLEATLVAPTGLGGTGEGGTNPEQLFAAGFAACFHSALRSVARRERLNLDGSQVTCTVSLRRMDEGHYTLAVSLAVGVPDLAIEVVEELTAAADRLCPYSNACRGDVEVDVKVILVEPS